MNRETRNLQNSKQKNISDINYYPAEMQEGEILFAFPKGKLLRLYKKINGVVWWLPFTRDGNYIFEGNVKVGGKINGSAISNLIRAAKNTLAGYIAEEWSAGAIQLGNIIQIITATGSIEFWMLYQNNGSVESDYKLIYGDWIWELKNIVDALKALILNGADYGKLLVGWGDGNVPHWINIWEEPLNIWTEQRYFWNEPKKPVVTTKLFDVEPLGLIANEIANSFETAEDSEQKSYGVSGLVNTDLFDTENCPINADALGSAFDYTVT